ncbi:Rad21 / Rec8 like protein, partial [Ostertagia ostertagi]
YSRRAATSGSAKKLPKRAVVEISVPNIHEILNFTPSKRSEEADLTSKFSLYLLGQLVYGLVLIYDRQVTLFSFDARSAYEACKRLPMEDLLSSDFPISDKARKRQRRSKLETREHNPDIDVDEEPVNRFVCLARPCDITMVENEPVIWQRPDVFFDDRNQLPIDLSKQGFINWNDLRSSGSSKESVEKVEEML